MHVIFRRVYPHPQAFFTKEECTLNPFGASEGKTDDENDKSQHPPPLGGNDKIGVRKTTLHCYIAKTLPAGQTQLDPTRSAARLPYW